jgi:hypothetical protein
MKTTNQQIFDELDGNMFAIASEAFSETMELVHSVIPFNTFVRTYMWMLDRRIASHLAKNVLMISDRDAVEPLSTADIQEFIDRQASADEEEGDA